MRFVSTAVLTFLVSQWMSPARQMAFNVVALLAASVLMSTALVGDTGTVGLTVTGVIVAGLGSYNMCSTIIAVVDKTIQVRDLSNRLTFGLPGFCMHVRVMTADMY